MNNVLIQKYNQLDRKNKKFVLIGGAIIAFIVLKKVYDIFFSEKVAEAKRNKQLISSIDKEIVKHSLRGFKPTFNDSEYNMLANQAYEGMRYAVGDNYNAVEKALKSMKNDLDVAKLLKAFGLRQDYAFGVPTGEPKDLFTFVKSELGEEYGGLVNYRITSINKDWQGKGITYKI
jgi:lysine/ornithine N-monooxygenase